MDVVVVVVVVVVLWDDLVIEWCDIGVVCRITCSL